MAESKQLYERIKAAVDEIWLVNSHDHFLQEPVRNARTVDLFSEFFSGYPGSDLVSAVCPAGTRVLSMYQFLRRNPE